MEQECTNPVTGALQWNDGFDINACAWCDDGKGHNTEDTARIWTKCTSLRFDADTLPNTDHYNCVTHSLIYMPSATNRAAKAMPRPTR